MLEETPFFLRRPVTLLLGPDETVQGAVAEDGAPLPRGDDRATGATGCATSRIPFEWQDAVIRAAITLKLNAFEDTGAIIAAMTTSIPEAAGSGRNWDYRYCWLRDAYFVVNALNRLGATRRWSAISATSSTSSPAPSGAAAAGLPHQRHGASIDERDVDSLPGYRGMGPVRVGNEAYRQVQHDVYGSAILAATHVFFDRRLRAARRRGAVPRLEALGERAAALFDQPDAGLWELRGAPRVHTFSSVMCWAACDRLARIAARLGLARARARTGARAPTRMHARDLRAGWNAQRSTLRRDVRRRHARREPAAAARARFPARRRSALRGDGARDRARPEARRFHLPLRGAGRLRRAARTRSSSAPSGTSTRSPRSAGATRRARCSRACSRAATARPARRAHRPATGEQWGNFVQTYSMVGLINSAMRLSHRLGPGLLRTPQHDAARR